MCHLPCWGAALWGCGSAAEPDQDHPAVAPVGWGEEVRDPPPYSPQHIAGTVETAQTKMAEEGTKDKICLHQTRLWKKKLLSLCLLANLSGLPVQEDGFWMWHYCLTLSLLGSPDLPSLLQLKGWHRQTQHGVLCQTYPAAPNTAQYKQADV